MEEQNSNKIRAAVEELIKDLLAARQVSKSYGKDHRLTKDGVSRLLLKLNDLLSVQAEITLGIIGGEIAFEKEPFYETSKKIGGFISHLEQMKIERISFLRGIDEGELLSLLDIINMTAEAVEKSGGVKDLAKSLGMRNIIFSRLSAGSGELTEDESDINSLARQNLEEGIRLLEKISDDIANNRQIDVRLAHFLINKIISNLLQNKESLFILTSLKSHDEYTFLHSLNVAILTLAQAEALGIKGDHLAEIGVAALLHDSGKLTLSADVIRKKEKLDQGDLDLIRKHPLDGAKILCDLPDINPLGAVVSFEHHIRFDSQGYPERLYGGKLNMASMMVSISDIYDALRSKRAYREDMVPEKTYDEMTKVAGTQLHPQLVENFFRIIGVYPPGTLVELDDKTVGLVIKENAADIRRPQVEILYAADGQKEKDPYIVSLLDKDNGGYRRTIVKSLAITGKFDLPEKYR